MTVTHVQTSAGSRLNDAVGRRRITRASACIVGALALGALSGCGSHEAPAEDAAAGQAAEAALDEATASDAATDAESDTEHTGAASGSCLEGRWIADNAFFLESMREFGDEIQSVTGEVTLDFAPDGTLTTTYADWRITAFTEGSEVIIVRAGTDTATYEATDSMLSMTETATGSMITLSGGGMEMAIDPEPVSYQQAGYECDAGAAQVTTPDGIMQLTRS